MIRYENAHFWAEKKTLQTISFPSNEPTVGRIVVKTTDRVIVRAASLDAEGETGEPFLVGVCPQGDTEVKLSHGSGFQFILEFSKGECWVFDDRAPTNAQAPVGQSFTRFEKLGSRMEDPVQILQHRANVRRALEGMAERRGGQPSEADELREQLARLNARLDQMGTKPDETDGTADSGAEANAS